MSADVTEMDLGEGRTVTLQRRPPVRATTPDALRAFDAADRYLLKTVPQDRAATLVANDRFGALAAGLLMTAQGPRRDGYALQWWSDSHRARLAMDDNLVANGLDATAVTVVTGDKDPAGPIERVVLRLPKSLVWLEDQLLRLRPHLAAGAQVVAGGMIKHTPRRAYELLEACIGPTKTSLGWKKARLATATFDDALVCRPRVAPSRVDVPSLGRSLVVRPNGFSWGRLDLGTRLLLANLQAVEGLAASTRPVAAVDLGCGNGVLAFAVAQICPNAAVLGIDESYQAIASARDNAAAVPRPGDHGPVTFEAADALASVVEPASIDLVVCNPPFHEQHAVAERVASDMFADARRALRPGGQLLVVANRHLGHAERLKQLFGRSAVVVATSKFVVLSARR